MLEKTAIKCSAAKIFELTKHLEPGKNSVNLPTGDFFYDQWKIEDRFKNTEIEKLLSSIPDCGEARIIVMKPGESYSAHSDIDDRYHVTLDAENSFLIDLDNNEMHKLEVDDIVYVMDTGRIHTAANFGYKNRYQLVIRRLLKRNELKDPVSIVCKAFNIPYNFRYQFDQTMSVFLNHANKKSYITNFKKVSDKIITFDIEKTMLEQLKKTALECGNIGISHETLL